jgi:hypothetical protein
MRHEVKIPESYRERLTKDVRLFKDIPRDIKIVQHAYEHRGDEKYWNYTSYDVYLRNELVLSFNRNYSTCPPFEYAKINNKEYLITSGDYQCITVLDLTERKIYDFTNEEGYKFGCGFCPLDITYDGDDKTLFVEGCIWGCPYETIIFRNVNLLNIDFSTAEHEDDEDEYCDYEEK